MLPPSVLGYDDYRSFLKNVLDEKVRKNPTFSLRAFARLVGMSPSHLSRALSGKKRLSEVSARRISQALNHSTEEAEHFIGLIELEATDCNEQKARILRRLKPQAKAKVVTLDAFRAIADWYHFAILALTNTIGFTADPLWIARRIGIKPIEAKLAVERLQGLGLLEKNGRAWKAANESNITTTDDLASAAIQENHRQHLELAGSALRELEVELREFNNLTLAMNPEDVPKAKKLIRAFIDRFNEELETKPGRELFQLNVQFYMLSKSERGRA